MKNCNNDIPKPLIDMAPLCSPDCKDIEFHRIGKEIVKCFENPGFVYLTNAGVRSEEIKDFVKAFDKFGELDDETKRKYYRDKEILHGFSTETTELLNSDIPLSKRTMRTMFDVQGFDEKFPEEVPELKAAAISITKNIVPIANIILKAIEIGFDLPNRFLVDKHQHMLGTKSFSDLRVTSYCTPSTVDQTIRCEAHCDFCTITLQLYEDLEGLQLLNSQGNWQTAKLYEGYFLLFPSEQLQMMTDGRVKALKHQVVNPTDFTDILKPRHAVLFFIHADHDMDIRPYNHKDDYPLMTSAEFSKQKANGYFKNIPHLVADKL